MSASPGSTRARPAGWARALLAAAAVAALAFGCSRREPPPNIVLIVIDTLRADHLGCYGYIRGTSPFLDGFARKAIRFDAAYATAPWTPPSIASIFTGLYPTEHGVGAWTARGVLGDTPPRAAVLDASRVTLAESLRDRGYRTIGVTGNSWIADYLGFSQGFDAFASLDFEPATAVNRLAVSTLEHNWDGKTPLFFYVHYVEPHEYARHQPYHDRFAGESYDGAYDGAMRAAIDSYDAEIHEVDQRLGELFEALRARGLRDDTVIAIVGDHGEGFYEHGFHGHGWQLHGEEIRVPLLLRVPRRAARTDVAVSLLDLYATLLELAGASVPPGTPSRSLFDVDAILARGGVLSENTVGEDPVHPGLIYKSFTRTDRKKLILEFAAGRNELIDEQRETGASELFDARGDPRERSALEDPALRDALHAAFYAAYRPARAKAPPPDATTAELDPERRRKLFELGYLR